MEIKIDRDAFKRVSDSLRSLVEAAEKTSREINRLYDITMESRLKKIKNEILDTSEKTETESLSEYISFVSLLYLLSKSERLPKKIRYNDVIYTNVTKTNMNLLYYNDENNLNFKTELLEKRISGETDIDILNRTIEVIEW